MPFSMDFPDSNDFTARLASLTDDLSRQRFPAGALYVVATPIGNLADISVRALMVLCIADAVACEDTRNTGQMLSHYGIAKPLFAAHQHNEREAARAIIERLQHGDRIALVSDAGTPAISDPGAHIVDAVRAAGCAVIPIAGASAAIAALSASGLLPAQFHFVGFLPSKDRQREAALEPLITSPTTLIFYEAPHRIMATVDALRRAFGPDRRVVIARELSKLFEQIHRCPLAEAGDWLAADANRQRGEFVLIVEGATEAADDSTDARKLLAVLLEAVPVSQAAAMAARITGQKKNALYALALEISEAASAKR